VLRFYPEQAGQPASYGFSLLLMAPLLAPDDVFLPKVEQRSYVCIATPKSHRLAFNGSSQPLYCRIRTNGKLAMTCITERQSVNLARRDGRNASVSIIGCSLLLVRLFTLFKFWRILLSSNKGLCMNIERGLHCEADSLHRYRTFESAKM
jgi:hypothetical protein